MILKSILLGNAIGLGFFGTLLAGIAALIIGDSSMFTAFVVYAGFWLSYGLLLLSDNATAAITGDINALGAYWICWWVATFVSFLLGQSNLMRFIGNFYTDLLD